MEIIYTNSFENLANGGEITVNNVDGSKNVFSVGSGNFRDAYNLLQNLWNVKLRRTKRDAAQEEDDEKKKKELREKYARGEIPDATPEETEAFRLHQEQKRAKKLQEEKDAASATPAPPATPTPPPGPPPTSTPSTVTPAPSVPTPASSPAPPSTPTPAPPPSTPTPAPAPTVIPSSASSPAPAQPSPAPAAAPATPTPTPVNTTVVSTHVGPQMTALMSWIENERKLREKEISKFNETHLKITEKSLKHGSEQMERFLSSVEEGSKRTEKLLETGNTQMNNFLVTIEEGSKRTEKLLADLIAGQKALSTEAKRATNQLRSSSTAGLSEHQYKKYGFSFDYDALIERIVLKIDKLRISDIEFSAGLAYFCGFIPDVPLSQTFNYATYKIDFFNNSTAMYVYSDVIQPTIVADKKTQLLRVVPASVDVNSVQAVVFSPIRYFPVNTEKIDCIKIDICNEFGENIKFHYGSTICTLNFVKIA
ncbi:hypothetical protein DXG03_006939 [Asterophora parasitica]|uniref:Uncharacterized protein n=1 Tax=Asterophora parasitica TaxID=117018 RepID=A0A9P7FYC3_9AGAR|nr:hypothetical protein DXG03_006939 [Asterophora parasitica]